MYVATASAEQIRVHLCYELKWMLRSVVRFEQLTAELETAGVGNETSADSDLVALQDSALLHARNLVEFANRVVGPG